MVLAALGIAGVGAASLGGSGRDGRSPLRPPVRTRRADFPHRAPQNRSVARQVKGSDPCLSHPWGWEAEPWLGVQARPVTVACRLLAALPQYRPPEFPDPPSHTVER